MMGVREEEWGVAGKGSEHEDARPESVLDQILKEFQDNKVLTVRKGNLWTYGGSGSIHERTGPKSVKIPRLCLLQCHQSLGLTVNKTHIFLPAGLVS